MQPRRESSRSSRSGCSGSTRRKCWRRRRPRRPRPGGSSRQRRPSCGPPRRRRCWRSAARGCRRSWPSAQASPPSRRSWRGTRLWWSAPMRTTASRWPCWAWRTPSLRAGARGRSWSSCGRRRARPTPSSRASWRSCRRDAPSSAVAPQPCPRSPFCASAWPRRWTTWPRLRSCRPGGASSASSWAGPSGGSTCWIRTPRRCRTTACRARCPRRSATWWR
mmetsp:Transcript_28813/g.91827  ORF Transcript_28813/g.91827 Transcript_28813/m.91827 type:complete len:220 (-) Transcript_28813:279-938(-)